MGWVVTHCGGRRSRLTCGQVRITRLLGDLLVYRVEYSASGRQVMKTYQSETPLPPGQMIAIDGASLIVERVRHGIAFCKLTL